MKLLLDEMLPVRLGRFLIGHEASHVIRLGWRNITNGKLLTLADEAGFDALITRDTNMPFQQSLAGKRIALVVVSPIDQTRESLVALAPLVLEALPGIQPGAISRVIQTR